jgi:hypothetical protein
MEKNTKNLFWATRLKNLCYNKHQNSEDILWQQIFCCQLLHAKERIQGVNAIQTSGFRPCLLL